MIEAVEYACINNKLAAVSQYNTCTAQIYIHTLKFSPTYIPVDEVSKKGQRQYAQQDTRLRWKMVNKRPKKLHHRARENSDDLDYVGKRASRARAFFNSNAAGTASCLRHHTGTTVPMTSIAISSCNLLYVT